MRKKYNIYRATKEELNAQVINHAHRKLNYALNSKEIKAFIKGVNYILYRLRNSELDPMILEKTEVFNAIVEENISTDRARTEKEGGNL